MDFKIFRSPQFGEIRTIQRGGEVPLFVARDISKALCFGAIDRPINDYCKHIEMVDNPRYRGKKIRAIPESDVYRLALRSRSKSAVDFQDWICEEVLPTLRGTSFVVYADNVGQEQVRNSMIASSTTEQDAEEILKFANINAQTEKRISELERKMAEVIEQIGIFEDIDKNYSTLPGYIQRFRLPILVSEYAHLGSRISEICKKRGIKICKITDVRGTLNLYPNYILQELFKDYMK